jgi:hypothetical protein
MKVSIVIEDKEKLEIDVKQEDRDLLIKVLSVFDNTKSGKIKM